MAVEGQGGLEAQGVARAEARGQEARGLAGLEQGLEDRRGPLAGEVELEAVRARVAGAGDQGRLPGQLELREGEASQLASLDAADALEDRRAGGPLEGEQPGGVAAIAHGRPRADVGLDPGSVLLDVGRVHAQEERVLGQPVDGDVVHDAAVLVAQAAVAHPSRPQRCDAAGDETLRGSHGPRALQMDLAHVRDVEDPDALAHGGVLRLD